MLNAEWTHGPRHSTAAQNNTETAERDRRESLVRHKLTVLPQHYKQLLLLIVVELLLTSTRRNVDNDDETTIMEAIGKFSR